MPNNTVINCVLLVLCIVINVQECIPVGCVPSTAVAVSEVGGGCLPRRVSAQGAVSAWGGCPPRGVSA